MKKIIILLFMVFVVSIFAQDEDYSDSKKSSATQNQSEEKKSDNIKIGIVDINKIANESKSLKILIKEMESTIKIKEDALDKKINEYNELKNKIEQQKSVISSEELDKKTKELILLKEAISDLKYDIDKTMKRSEEESIDPALDRILEAVKSVAEEKKLDVVMRSDLLLYMNKSCDITNDVIKKLDDITEKNPIPLPKK